MNMKINFCVVYPKRNTTMLYFIFFALPSKDIFRNQIKSVKVFQENSYVLIFVLIKPLKLLWKGKKTLEDQSPALC